jgi:hypothetical protein
VRGTEEERYVSLKMEFEIVWTLEWYKNTSKVKMKKVFIYMLCVKNRERCKQEPTASI